MALSVGKLTLIVGAGIIGSVLVKEGRIPSVSDILSAALKIALKPITQNDSSNSTSKPRNDALIAQVNNLRQELQLLSSNRSVTIVTSSVKDGLRYGGIIVIVVIGCGYVWWKGWKLPDFMFATKCGLADACNSVAKELDQVYSGILETQRGLSSQIDGRTEKYDGFVTLNEAIQHQAAEIQEKVQKCPVALQTMIKRIETMETKADSFKGKQVEVVHQMEHLIKCSVSHLENRDPDLIQDSPSCSRRPALEHQPQIANCSRTGSLPLVLPLELPSPAATIGSSEFQTRLGICGSGEKTEGPRLPNGNRVTSPSMELPQRQHPVFRRTISATQCFK